jgi:hypothetical protein
LNPSPADLRKLVYLDIGHNEFKELPGFIAGFKDLTHLDIGHTGEQGKLGRRERRRVVVGLQVRVQS